MATETDHSTIPAAADERGLTAWLTQVQAFAVRSARELFRNKTVLFWSIAFPAGFYLLTITIFVDTSQIPSDVLPYVKAGTAITYGTFGAIIASLNAFGQQLALDFEDQRYQLYRSLPIGPVADLTGRMVAGVALSVAAIVAVLAVAVATGASFGLASVASLPVVAVAIVTFTVFWMVVAVLVTTAVRDTRYASIITVSMALALYFLTGYNGGEPSVFQGPAWVLNWLPNTLPTRLLIDHLVDAPQEFVEAGGVGPPGTLFGTGLLLAYAAVAMAVGVVVMRRVVYKRGVLP